MIRALQWMAIPILNFGIEERPLPPSEENDANLLHFNYLLKLSDFGTPRVTQKGKIPGAGTAMGSARASENRNQGEWNAAD